MDHPSPGAAKIPTTGAYRKHHGFGVSIPIFFLHGYSEMCWVIVVYVRTEWCVPSGIRPLSLNSTGLRTRRPAFFGFDSSGARLLLDDMALPSKAGVLVRELKNAPTPSDQADFLASSGFEILDLWQAAEIKASGLINLLLDLGNPLQSERLTVSCLKSCPYSDRS